MQDEREKLIKTIAASLEAQPDGWMDFEKHARDVLSAIEQAGGCAPEEPSTKEIQALRSSLYESNILCDCACEGWEPSPSISGNKRNDCDHATEYTWNALETAIRAMRKAAKEG